MPLKNVQLLIAMQPVCQKTKRIYPPLIADSYTAVSSGDATYLRAHAHKSKSIENSD